MYNEEQKLRFIQYKENMIDTKQDILTTRFEQSEEMEAKLGKDISEFTAYELIEFYKRRNSASIETLIVTDSLLSEYTEWCIMNNLVRDGQNHHVEINNEILRDCVNDIKRRSRLITREQLEEYIEKGHNGRTLDNPVDRFVLLAIFEGIKGDEFADLSHLSMDDFCGNYVTTPISRIKFKVSDELLKYARLSNDTYEYYPLTDHDIAGKPKQLSGNLIIKDYHNTKDNVSDHQRGRRLYSKVKKITNYLGLDLELSLKSLYESGKIDYIRRCAANENISPEELLSRPGNPVVKKYGNVRKVIIMRKYGDYLQ